MAFSLKNNTAKGIGMTAGAGIIFGAFPIFTSLYVQFGGDVNSFNLYGFILTVVILAAYILLTKKSFRIPRKSIFFVFLAGFFNVVTRILLTNSYLYLDVGIATTLHFMYPLFAALIGALFFREKMPLYKWAAFLVASFSVSLFTSSYQEGGQLKGIILALASAVCFALYMLTTEKADLARMDPVVFVFYVSLVSTVGCDFMGIEGMTLMIPGKAIAILVACAIVNNFLAFALQQQGVRYMGAAMAALFSLFEPIFSCIFGAVFLSQAMGGRSLLGIALILLSLVLIVVMDNRKKPA